MSSPTNSQNPPNAPPVDSTLTQQQDQNQSLPQPENPESPKTLTLKFPNNEGRNPESDPIRIDNDANQSDPEDNAGFPPTLADYQVSSTPTNSRRGGGGYMKRKKRRGGGVQGKKLQQKLENLAKTLNPIPFVPVKALDFASHESLLKRLGLWDFVHLQFDVDSLRSDLIAQLIVYFSLQCRCSHVNDVRIKVSRPDLARALQLPVKKDKVDNAVEFKEDKESIEFIEEFVSTWLLLHEDTWMMPDDILNVTKLIKDGNFEKIDWSKLVWLMVEKELAAPNLGNCYYASHLQLLMKSQKDDLFKGEAVKMEIDAKEDEEEEEEDGKLTEETHGVAELEEHNIELSLGGLDNMIKDDADDDEKDGKKEVSGGVDANAMDFEDIKEDDEQRQWRKSSMDGCFLQRCNLGEVGGVECEVERKLEEGERVEEENEGDYVEGEEEEEEEEEIGFNVSPKGDALEGVCSENLIAAMETSPIPFSSGMRIQDNVIPGDFLSARADTQSIPGSSSLFSNGNGNKREIEHLDNDMPHHPLNGANKRLRSDGPWDGKSPSEFDMCLEQAERIIGKARMMYEAKEQAFQEMSIHQQMLMSELQQRENYIQQLHKVRLEEQQKKQMETYRLEHELYMMGSLLEGYRKALKQAHKAFSDYRAKCPLPEEPIYKDTGSGGLVLSTVELEKLRLKQEEEEKQKRLFFQKKAEEFEAPWMEKLESCNVTVEQLWDRLAKVAKTVDFVKEESSKRKALEKSESAPAEESAILESA